MKRLLLVVISGAWLNAGLATGAAIFNGSYFQSFDSLPTDAPNNGNLEEVYADGWQDDVNPALTPEDDISIPGWYLYHPQWTSGFTGGEGGFNEHQRLRMGDGRSNTGSFWLYGNGGASDAEKALGIQPSDNLANPAQSTSSAEFMYIGLRLTNNTSATIRRLNLTFVMEQWHDGVANPNEPDSLRVQVLSIPGGIVTPDNWFTLSNQPAIGAAGARIIGTVNTVIDGNGDGRRVVSLNTGNLVWDRNQDLWFRWGMENGIGQDDGLAIDNVSISVVPEPSGVVLAGLGIPIAMSMARRLRPSFLGMKTSQ